jgi:hypothetical protein
MMHYHFVCVSLSLSLSSQRLPGGKILFEDQVYTDIEEFLKMNKTLCKIPFENDNAVTYTQVREVTSSCSLFSILNSVVLLTFDEVFTNY